MSERAAERRAEIADTLRGRILRGLQAGALRLGDRLPSARELEAEFDVDHRTILDAYRELAAEGLLELRTRGGIYVAATQGPGGVPFPPESWLVDVFAQGIAREIPAVELYDWFRRGVRTLRLRAVIVQASVDQIVGLCKELEDDYGFEASGVEAQALDDGAVPPELLYADLLVTTKGHESIVCELASRLDKPCIIVDIRPDLIGGDWRLLLNRPVYVVVHDARFVPAMLAFFATVPGADNIRPLVLGVDDLGCIPDDASTYVTRSARQQMKDVVIPGRLLPTTRLIASESARELLRFVVHANLEVLAARGR